MIKTLQARPRLLVSAVFAVLLQASLPPDWREATRLLVAWDAGVGLYLLLVAQMMAGSSFEKIKQRAALQDEGRLGFLALTTLAALASLAAIVAELASAKALSGHGEGQHILLAALTVVLSWAFLHTMFALHYAHEYYRGHGAAGTACLEFPGGAPPDYWDFVYYAFVIGTSTATADVNILSRHVRRLTGAHCVVAFFFNTTILALTINIAAGLF